MAVNDRATARRYWLTTLGCPKNEVDSEKLVTLLAAEGLTAADGPESAELVVVNTCAFIDAARQESIDTILAMQDAAAPGAQVVVTGCMAQRYEAELADAEVPRELPCRKFLNAPRHTVDPVLRGAACLAVNIRDKLVDRIVA